ncbi:MAG: EF-hand domain-containing protein [Pirellulales bacterium]
MVLNTGNWNIGSWQKIIHTITPIAVTPQNLFALSLLALAIGCSGMPGRVVPPGIDPEDAAEQAMEIYDTDGDGFVADSELDNAPGLKAAMKTLDTDGDEKVSEEEVAERIRAWQKTGVGITSINCKVLIKNLPLQGATVTFVPEVFLGDEIKAAVGISGPLGELSPKIPKENRPRPDSPPGLQLGLYQVRVSKMVKGKETIPAKYNTETTFGQEVSDDDPAIQGHRVIFKVTKK